MGLDLCTPYRRWISHWLQDERAGAGARAWWMGGSAGDLGREWDAGMTGVFAASVESDGWLATTSGCGLGEEWSCNLGNARSMSQMSRVSSRVSRVSSRRKNNDMTSTCEKRYKKRKENKGTPLPLISISYPTPTLPAPVPPNSTNKHFPPLQPHTYPTHPHPPPYHYQYQPN